MLPWEVGNVSESFQLNLRPSSCSFLLHLEFVVELHFLLRKFIFLFKLCRKRLVFSWIPVLHIVKSYFQFFLDVSSQSYFSILKVKYLVSQSETSFEFAGFGHFLFLFCEDQCFLLKKAKETLKSVVALFLTSLMEIKFISLRWTERKSLKIFIKLCSFLLYNTSSDKTFWTSVDVSENLI